ncbi:MAG: DUF6134 family protein [Alphaproteobacteria bacterium]
MIAQIATIIGPVTRGDARRAALAATAWCLVALAPTAARAGCTAPAERLDYVISWAGGAIGHQQIVFEGAGDRLSVRTKMRVHASLLFVSLIDLAHDSEEIWVGGRLHSYRGRTVDNEAVTDIAIRPDGEGLLVTRNAEATRVPSDALPGSLWCAQTLAKAGPNVLIDLVKGRTGQVAVSAPREEVVSVRGAEVRVRKVEIQGFFEREVWHDSNGVGVRARFPAKLGPKVVVELQ